MPMRTSPVWLLLLATMAYGASVFGTFYLDDFAIFSDPVLTSESGWWEVWRLGQTRPLTYFTFWVNSVLGGSEAVGYHAVNFGLHLCAVWLAFAALRRMMDERAAWVAAAIFAAHPLQAEAVNYVFARSTLLMAVFCLLSLRAWMDKRAWPAVGWFAVALLAKEEAVAWPLVLIAMHWWFRRSASEWKALAAMLGLAMVFGLRVLVVASETAGSGAGAQAGVSAWDYFWTQGLIVWRYVASAVVAVWPPYRIESPVAVGFCWWGWLGVLVVAVLAVRWRRAAGFWLMAALLLLLPSSSVFPASDLSADRRMYLPLLFVAAGLSASVRRLEWALLPLVALSAMRTWDWLDAERFWRAQAVSGSARSMVQLARVVPESEAVRVLEEAKGKNADDALVASELGRVYLSSGAVDKALAEFGRALALAPDNPQALSNRGVALLMLKQPDAAGADFERALQIDPCAFEARLNAMRMGLSIRPAPAQCRYTPEERRALNGE